MGEHMPGLSVHKDEAQPLPKQISSIIRMKIERGEYRPGKKLKTIRQYADEFSVSPVTVIRALDILEEETLIERVPVKGVFVSQQASSAKKPLTACFAFPEKGLVPFPGNRENWSLNFELFHGLLTGARQNGIELQFAYFEDTPQPRLLEKQKTALQKFDFVIFPGPGQLVDLRNASAAERLTFCLASRKQYTDLSPEVIKIDYDRENTTDYLIGYLLKTSCRSAGAITNTAHQISRAAGFLDAAREKGIRVFDSALLRLEKNDVNAMAKIKDYLLSRRHEFIFVDYTEMMPLIYEAAYQEGLTVGKDFIPTGIASEMIFSGLFPRPSYFRIPRYEMGAGIMDAAKKFLRGDKRNGKVPEFRLEFIEGHCLYGGPQKKAMCETAADLPESDTAVPVRFSRKIGS